MDIYCFFHSIDSTADHTPKVFHEKSLKSVPAGYYKMNDFQALNRRSEGKSAQKLSAINCQPTNLHPTDAQTEVT